MIWHQTIEQPDASGSFSLNISAPLLLEDSPWLLSERGCVFFNSQTNTIQHNAEDVVRFVSRPNEPHLFHTASLICGGADGSSPCYALPPNTLLQLESIENPPWQATFRRWHVYSAWTGMPGAVNPKTGLPIDRANCKECKYNSSKTQ